MNSPTTTNARHRPVELQRLLFVYGMVLLVALAYWPATSVLLDFWTDTRDLGGTHGLLVVGITAWLLFRARRRIGAARLAPSSLGCALLFASGLAWLVLFRAGLQDLHLLVLPALIWLIGLAMFGWEVARATAFPAGLLYFTLPIWGNFAWPLQMMTTHTVGFMSALAGIRVFITDNYVHIPEGVFEIAEGCSGVHFFVVGLFVGALHGELSCMTRRRRIATFLALGAASIVANWIRVLTIVIAGHMTNMQHTLIVHGHYWFGWCVFAVVLMLFFLIESRIKAAYVAQPRFEPSTDALDWRLFGIVMALVIAAPLTATFVDRVSPPSAASDAGELPTTTGEWTGPAAAIASGWKPQFTGPHRQVQGLYRNATDEWIEAVAVIYPSQRQGVELVGESSSLLGPDLHIEDGEHTIHVPAGAFREAIAVNEAGQQFLIWSVYDIGGRRFAVPMLSQLWYGLRSVAGAPTSMLLAVRTRCEPSCDVARTRLEGFWRDSGNLRVADGRRP
jgi:EpsI family protein